MIGDRIKQARLIAGMTEDQVVEKLAAAGFQLSKEEFLAFEQHEAFPRAGHVLELGSLFNVPPAYFLQEPEVKITWVAYRKMPHLAGLQDARIQAFARDCAEKQIWLQNQIFPDDTPSFPHPLPVQTEQDAERAAEYLRQEWNLGESPITSVAQAFEYHGGILISWPQDQGIFDGLAGWANDTIPIAVINSSTTSDRRRFNLAHELGHLVMLCDRLPEEEQEKLAQRFATAFLVPAKVAIRELRSKREKISLEELSVLNEEYGLSMRSWILRAHELEIISDAERDELFQALKTRDFSGKEPTDKFGEEEPRKLKKMIFHALASADITEEKALDLCPGCIDISEKRSVVVMPPGRKYSTSDLLALSEEERAKVFAEIPTEAIEAYLADEDLNAFALICDDIVEDYL